MNPRGQGSDISQNLLARKPVEHLDLAGINLMAIASAIRVKNCEVTHKKE